MDQMFVLAGDVGGTKTNLGIYSHGEERPLALTVTEFESNDFVRLEDMLSSFLARGNTSFSAVCIAVAGPVRRGAAKVTNLPWTVETERISCALGRVKTKIINDLAATAKSVPFLEDEDILTIQEGYYDSAGPVGIIAPGTGLGMALAFKEAGTLATMASEGGHVDFAPTCELEIELLRAVSAQIGRVSLERLLSGAGLVRIYQFLASRSEQRGLPTGTTRVAAPTPRLIREAGLSGEDPIAARSLELFVSMLGSAAGNLALTGLTTGGMYFAGGLSPKILPHFGREALLRAFSAKGRFEDLMKDIPAHVILNERAPLLGAAVCAFETLRAT
jgi:glucokinase